MQRGHLRAFDHPAQVGLRVEEADVVGDGAGEQCVVLHDGGHALAPAVHTDLRQRHIVDADLPFGGRVGAQQQVDQGGLAAARAAGDGHHLAGGDVQRQAVDHPGRLVGVAVAHAGQGQGRNAGRVGAHGGQIACIQPLRSRRGGREHQIGQALGVQAQHLQVDGLVDQGHDAVIKLVAVGHEGHQHAHGQFVGDDLLRPQPDDQQHEAAAQQAAHQAVEDQQFFDLELRIGGAHQQCLPGALALRLAAKQLDGAHAADALQVVAGFAGAAHQRLFVGGIKGAVPEQAHRQVQQHRQQCHPGQQRAVDEHQPQRQQHQQAVEHRFDESGGEGVLNLVDRARARDDVAQVAVLKVRQRQPCHVRKHVRFPLHANRGLDDHQQPRAHQRRALLQQHQQPEADGQRGEQLGVARDHHMVQHPLHEQGRDQAKHLQRQRQQQHLAQRRPEARDLADQLRQAHPGLVFFRRETGVGPQLQCHAGEVLRNLLQRQAPLAKGRVVYHGLTVPHRLEHHEVVQVPVQDGGQPQLRQLVQVQPQAARAQLFLARDLGQRGQGHARQGDGVARAQRRQIGAGAMVVEHHGQAGQATFGGLGLQDHRQAAAQAKGKLVGPGQGAVSGVAWRRVTLNRGSSIHS